MATQKISEMTEASILLDEDYVPIVQAGVNKKTKTELFRDYDKLHNKPTINGVTVEQNKTIDDYNITKENQGIKTNDATKQTLELEVPTDLEMESRADVNKAVTVKTADKMAKETAHQEMSKEYLPNEQEKLTQGENQPVSYKAVKGYVDSLETKVDENELDIENKHTALNEKVDANETDIENKYSALSTKVDENKSDIEQKYSSLNTKVDENEQDIEQKVTSLQTQTAEKDAELQDLITQNTNNIEINKNDIQQLKEKGSGDGVPKFSSLFYQEGQPIPDGYAASDKLIPAELVEMSDGTTVETSITDIKTQGVSVADTLPIGAQVMWDNTSSIPEGWEEVETEVYNPIQLLINNDFQINQRGRTVYDNDGYTLDMWYFYKSLGGKQGSITIKPDGSINVKNTSSNWVGLSQRISDEYRGKTVTLVIKVKNCKRASEVGNSSASINDYALNVRITEADTIQGIIGEASYGVIKIDEDGVYYAVCNIPSSATYSMLKFAILVAGECDIEYVDLFEGDITYQHQKENYAIAFIRCQEFAQLIKYSFTTFALNTTMGITHTIQLPIKMRNIPTISVISEGVPAQCKDVVETYSQYGNVLVTMHGEIDNSFTRIMERTILISCEPL